MVSTRRSANQNQTRHSSSRSKIVEDLLSSLHSSQELKLLELKNLYFLLVQLSLDRTIDTKTTKCSNLPKLKIGPDEISVQFTAISSLSDTLFKKLLEMFKEFLSTFHNISASFPEQESLHFDICVTAEKLNLLFRCCMVMLKLLVHDQNRLVENGSVLHAILAKSCTLNLNRGNEQGAIHFEKMSQIYESDGTHSSLFTEDFVASLEFIEPIDHCRHFFCTMLEITELIGFQRHIHAFFFQAYEMEVFVDEFLSHKQIREYFELIDSCSTGNKLYMSQPNKGDIGSVLELICTHFCMSFSDEQTFVSIDDKLFEFQSGKSRIPELGPISASNLLQNPLILMAPKYLQAHLINLCSESLNSATDLQNGVLINCYLTAFQKSVSLYHKHMSSSGMDLKGSSQLPFESYIQPATRKQLDCLIRKIDNSLQLQLKHRCLRSKSDIVASSIAHISNTREFLSTSFKDEIISISSSIILNAFPGEVVGNALHTGCDTKPDSIFLLASIMKLMSCSLLQVTRYLMNKGALDYSRSLKDLSTCKEHKILMEVISRFDECDVSLPIQKSLITAIDKEKHKTSKMMLIHFSGLLSLSYKSGIDVLLKGCISVIVTLMNLFIFEEGNLDALRAADESELFPSYLTQENSREAVAGRRSSLVIASKFEKIRALYLSRPSETCSYTETENNNTETSADPLISNDTQCGMDIEEKTEEACHGSIFLKCVMKNDENAHDFDDLADFIECKKGKDYSGWLKDRQMYRKKRLEKLAVIKWKKKKRTWKYLKVDRA